MIVLTADNWKENVLKQGAMPGIFIYFEQLDCKMCRKDATPLNKLAKHMKGRPRVARADCTGLGKSVCAAFGVGRIAPIPCTLFVSQDKAVYKYVQAKDSVLDFELVKGFIEGRKYLNFPKLRLDPSIEHFVTVNENGR